MAAKFK